MDLKEEVDWIHLAQDMYPVVYCFVHSSEFLGSIKCRKFLPHAQLLKKGLLCEVIVWVLVHKTFNNLY
jgi:hypothetical protein